MRFATCQDNRRPRCRAAVVAAAVLLAGACYAGEPPMASMPPMPGDGESPVEAKLVFNTSAVRPGEPFTAGVLLKTKPGYHTYWINPGDAGLPTEVAFTLPEGFTVGRLRWPMPTKFVQPGDIAGYGYAGSVLLSAEITPPKDLTPGTPVDIAAKVSWLACKTACIPGDAELAGRLTVAPDGDAATPANVKLFARHADDLPTPATAPDSPADVRVAGKLAETDKQADFTIDLAWRKDHAPAREPKLEAFLAGPDAVAVKDVRIAPTDGGARVTFTAERWAGIEFNRNNAAAVVVYVDARGTRRGIEISVPLRDEPKTETDPSKQGEPEAHEEDR